MPTSQPTAADEARCIALRQEITQLLQSADEHRLRVVLQFVSALKK